MLLMRTDPVTHFLHCSSGLELPLGPIIVFWLFCRSGSQSEHPLGQGTHLDWLLRVYPSWHLPQITVWFCCPAVVAVAVVVVAGRPAAEVVVVAAVVS